jgi:hypothetical protein
MNTYGGLFLIAALFAAGTLLAHSPSHAKWAKDHPPSTKKVVYTSHPIAKKC